MSGSDDELEENLIMLAMMGSTEEKFDNEESANEAIRNLNEIYKEILDLPNSFKTGESEYMRSGYIDQKGRDEIITKMTISEWKNMFQKAIRKDFRESVDDINAQYRFIGEEDQVKVMQKFAGKEKQRKELEQKTEDMFARRRKNLLRELFTLNFIFLEGEMAVSDFRTEQTMIYGVASTDLASDSTAIFYKEATENSKKANVLATEMEATENDAPGGESKNGGRLPTFPTPVNSVRGENGNRVELPVGQIEKQLVDIKLRF